MAEIVGTSFVPRTELGLWTLDHAFHKEKVGFPAFGMVEVYGKPHVGKSTFVYSLSAMLGKLWDCNIALADLEGLDQEFLIDVLNAQGFDNKLLLVQEPSDEEVTAKMLELYASEDEKPTRIGILDSIGAISPIQELEGDMGAANMGRRARLMAQFSRKFTHQILGINDKILFMTNHQHQNLGSIGTITPGGKTLEYLSGVRIFLKMVKGYPDTTDTSLGYLLEGKITKNRYGGKGANFRAFFVSGIGIHKGVSAIFDAIYLGLIDSGKVVKIGDKSYGYMKGIIEKAQAGDDKFFKPFLNLFKEKE